MNICEKMSTVTMKIVDRKYLEGCYNLYFLMFDDCCSECKRRKTMQDELKTKRFYSFNSSVFIWKMIDDLNNFEIFPVCKDLNVKRCLIL